MSMSSTKLPPMYKSFAASANSDPDNNAGESGVKDQLSKPSLADSPTSNSPELSVKEPSKKFEQEYLSIMSHNDQKSNRGFSDKYSVHDNWQPNFTPTYPPNNKNIPASFRNNGPWSNSNNKNNERMEDQRRRFEDHSEVPWDADTRKLGFDQRPWEGSVPTSDHNMNGTYYFGPSGSGTPDYNKWGIPPSLPSDLAHNDLINGEREVSNHTPPKHQKSLMERYREFHQGVGKNKMQGKEAKGKHSPKGKTPSNSIFDSLIPMKFKKNNEIGLDEFIRQKFKPKPSKKPSSKSFGAGNKVPTKKPGKHTPSSPLFDSAIENHKTLSTKHFRKPDKVPATMQQFRKTMMAQHKFKHQPENLQRNTYAHNIFGNGHKKSAKLSAASLVKPGDREQKSLLSKKKELMEQIKNRGIQSGNAKRMKAFGVKGAEDKGVIRNTRTPLIEKRNNLVQI
ncbi:uncharacterized protein LOC110849108 [Folsomia candida]|nr:uncharacterized protein LOC110849108 [Folsomia candida]